MLEERAKKRASTRLAPTINGDEIAYIFNLWWTLELMRHAKPVRLGYHTYRSPVW